jgi:hypothetical protein
MEQSTNRVSEIRPEPRNSPRILNRDAQLRYAERSRALELRERRQSVPDRDVYAEVCPAWCWDAAAGHAPAATAQDRVHYSHSYLEWSMELERAELLDIQGAAERHAYAPRYITAYLVQHYREREPELHLVVGDEVRLRLTISEARQLADALDTAGEAATKGQDAGDRRVAGGLLGPVAAGAFDPFIGTCPPWCDCAGVHRLERRAADRTHFSAPYMDRVLELEEGEQRTGTWTPPVLRVYLSQNYRMAEPDLFVDVDESGAHRIELNPVWGEVRALVAGLRKAVAAASRSRAGGTPGGEPEQPEAATHAEAHRSAALMAVINAATTVAELEANLDRVRHSDTA